MTLPPGFAIPVRGNWFNMPCWNALSEDQQRCLITNGSLPFGWLPEGKCDSPAAIAIETSTDAAPGARFYCRACAVAYLSEPDRDQ
jgi:hypothetical protein